MATGDSPSVKRARQRDAEAGRVRRAEAAGARRQRLYDSVSNTQSRAPRYVKERARATAATAGRAASRNYVAARGGVGRVFVLATCIGIGIMVVRRPALITTPLAFITAIFRAFTTLAGKVTGN